ncbi:MAG: DNA polymerase III subunit beta [Deltaproteobacteria bacterium]|jgi:DNA polymerase-3 subunit beta|nr:DNA polymerase III subunit beta [Deltaproteobacteria bacterium]
MLQVNVNTADLVKAVNQAVSVSEKKSSLPVLAYFLVEAIEDRLVITASDLETTIRETCPAVVYSPGKLTVPAKQFHSVVRAVNGDSINLKEGEQLTLELVVGQFRTTFLGLSVENFPKLVDISEMTFRELPAENLRLAIDKVIYSVAGRGERYNLSGVYMVLEEVEDKKSIRFVTSDSKRLNISTVLDNAGDFELDRGVILSKKGVQELRKVAEEVEFIEIAVSFSCVVAKTRTSVLQFQLLEGGFPDYRGVIPVNHDREAKIDRKRFLETLKRVALISDDQARVGKFEFSRGRLTINLENPSIGQTEESLPIDYDGDDLTTGFNVFFFIESLSVLASDLVSLVFTDSKVSFLLTATEDPGYFGIIMASKL